MRGQVEASGAKNAALPLLAASLLCQGVTQLLRVPSLRDTKTMVELLSGLGLDCSWEQQSLNIRGGGGAGPTEAPYELVRRMRASVCVLGPLLAARHHAIVALPGGCVFGQRPIDIHLRAMESFGAEIKVAHGAVVAKAPVGGLKAAMIDLIGPFGTTVLGSANALMAASGIDGLSVLRNVAVEPEIVDLAKFLVAAGASIDGIGTATLEVRGAPQLTGPKWQVPADRIEAGTLLLAAAATRGKVRVKNCVPKDLSKLIDVLKATGVVVEQGPDWLEVSADGRLRAVGIKTASYPGFPTDLQAQWMAFVGTCEGSCEVEETVYPERFMHVDELNRLGAQISRHAATASVTGPQALSGAPVMASDLRASAALVIAALVASGESIVRRVYHLDRGYEALEMKLQSLGAEVVRCLDQQSP